ncbi:MAG: aromatic amino acid transport family protein [Oscillospiraceae bacterium]
MRKKRLTAWEAACIITGYGIGGGVLSMPYLAEKVGLLLSFVILVIALLASYILHLMIADLALKVSDGGQIIACLSQFLFRGKAKNLLTTLFFILMTLILFTNLAAYISGSKEIIVELLPISGVVATLIFYVIAASVVLFGLKAVGVSEKISVTVIFGLILALAVASFFAPSHALPLTGGTVNGVLAYYGMAMFAMAAFFSVPQAVEGLDKDKTQIKKAVFLGLFNNFIIIVVITFCALLASDKVTEVAMVGWSAGIGTWAQIVGGLFTILAMLTTYWSLSLALGSIVEEQMKWNSKMCWLIATLPSLILALFNFASFMEFMRLAGGLISIIIAIMVVPAYLNARREVEGSILTRCGGKVTAAVIILAYILMGIGSVVPV